MNVDKILLVVILASSTMFLPLFEPSTNIELAPLERKEILINIRQPVLSISVKGEQITINFSKIMNGERTELKTNMIVENQGSISDLSPGLYLLEISSLKFSKVLLDGRGMFSMNIGILSFLGLIVLVRVIKKA